MLKLVILVSLHLSGVFSAECGIQQIKPNIKLESFIVGGNAAIPNSWPWAVTIFEYGKHSCGGTIINESWILTANHCVDSMGRFKVGVGYHNLQKKGHGQMIKVTKVIEANFIDEEGAFDFRDLALLKLAKPIKFNKYIQPICLPEQGKEFKIGQKFVAVGWGSLKQGSAGPKDLNQVILPYIPDSVCSKDEWLGKSFLPGLEICAGYSEGGKDTCQGDSGGGLVYFHDEKWYQGGIVSHGNGCGDEKSPGVYVKVSEYVNWIKETIADN